MPLYFSHVIHSNLFHPIMHSYIAFGLTIQSEVLFRELLSTPYFVNEEYDITIKLGSVDPRGLNGLPPPQGVFYQVTSSKLWLHVPDVARFQVTNGHQIIIGGDLSCNPLGNNVICTS